MNTAILSAALIMLLAGCAPDLLRHYDVITPEASEPKVELSVFLANLKANEPAPVLSLLGERAQAELIRALASKMSNDSKPEDLLAALSMRPDEPSTRCAWAPKATVTKRLVFTVIGSFRLPADRIERTDITLTLTDDSVERARFVSWDHFDAQYRDFIIGTAKSTQSGNFSVGRVNTDVSNLPSAAGSVTKVMNIGAEASTTLEESASYALRKISIGGPLTPSSARLVREGGPNVNLSGSSEATITLSLQIAASPLGLYSFVLNKNKAPLEPSDVAVERCDALFPVSAKAISVDVKGDALLRVLRSGDTTVPEGDDDIVLQSMKMTPRSSPMTLLTDADLQLQAYALVRCDQRAKNLESCDRLHIEYNSVASGVEQIFLPTVDAAVKLRTWLVDQTKDKSLSAINGLAVGLASKEASADIEMSPDKLVRLLSNQAKELRVVRVPITEVAQER